MGKPSREHSHITGRVEVLESNELAELCASNKGNRRMSQANLDYLATQMPKEFLVTGESIIIGSDGKLYDGQHRCHVALAGGHSLIAFVVRGVDPKVFDLMGTGKPRTGADVIGMSDANSTQLSAGLGWLWRYDRKAMLLGIKSSGLTNRRLRNLLRRNPGMRDSVGELVNSKWQRDIGLRAGHATLHYLYSKIDAEKMAEFWEAMSPAGHRIGVQSPANVLVKWLTTNVVRAQRKAGDREVLAVTVKAIRAHFTGKRIKSLRWIASGPKAEDFPALMPDLKSHGVRKKKTTE